MVAKRGKKRKYHARIKASKETTARRGVLVSLAVVVSIGVLAVIIYALSYAGSLFFSRNPHFELKNIIMSSDGRLTPSWLIEYSGLLPGGNLFDVDFDELRKTMEDESTIKSVRIQRKLPDTLIVRVVERVAVAQVNWKWRGPVFLIDPEGIVLPPTRTGQALPLIEGLKFDKLRPGDKIDDAGVLYVLELLEASRSPQLSVLVDFERFDLRYPDFITATLVNGTSARFPRHSSKSKTVTLAATLEDAREKGKRVRTVDLTPDGRNVPITFY